MRQLLTLMFMFLFASGCGVTTPEYTAPAPVEAGETSVVIEESFDDTWNALIQYTSQRFFAIDSYEKDSGLMTLTFSSNPERFIDCGDISTDGPPSYEGPYVEWYQERSRASMDLDGRMNLTVEELSEEQTRVAVNVRYVVDVATGSSQLGPSWSFNTGGSDTQTVSANNFGAEQTRTCQPTHEAERVIIEGIQDQA